MSLGCIRGLLIVALPVTLLAAGVARANNPPNEQDWRHTFYYLSADDPDQGQVPGAPDFTKIIIEYSENLSEDAEVIAKSIPAVPTVETQGSVVTVTWPAIVGPGLYFALDFKSTEAGLEFLFAVLEDVNGQAVGVLWPDGRITPSMASGEVKALMNHSAGKHKPGLPSIPDHVNQEVRGKLLTLINDWGTKLSTALTDVDANNNHKRPIRGHFDQASLTMANLYWGGATENLYATLLPTVANLWDLYTNENKPAGCPAGLEQPRIRQYFNCVFLPSKPKLIKIDKWHWTHLATKKVAEGVPQGQLISVQGTYLFHKWDKTLKRVVQVRARFTFVLESRDSEGWLIIQHHSSISPSKDYNAIVPLPGGPDEEDDDDEKKCCKCYGDVNCDGVVDWFDIIEILENWGPCPDKKDSVTDLIDLFERPNAPSADCVSD